LEGVGDAKKTKNLIDCLVAVVKDLSTRRIVDCIQKA
jgi:hypothetical protein